MAEKRTTATERKVQAHPNPKYYSLVEDFRKANDMGRSEAVNLMIKTFFDKMPQAEIERIRNLAKNHY